MAVRVKTAMYSSTAAFVLRSTLVGSGRAQGGQSGAPRRERMKG